MGDGERGMGDGNFAYLLRKVRLSFIPNYS